MKKLCKLFALAALFFSAACEQKPMVPELLLDRIEDENIVLDNFEIDTDALKGLGCDYIFSAVKINNSDELNLTLLDVFTTDTSKIEIYVYEL